MKDLTIITIIICILTIFIEINSFNNIIFNQHQCKHYNHDKLYLMSLGRFTSRKKTNNKSVFKPKFNLSNKLTNKLTNNKIDSKPTSNNINNSNNKDESKGPFIERLYKNKDRFSLSTLAVGQKHKGRIISLTEFGMYVDIGTKGDGLVHVKDMSKDYFIKDFRSLYSPGLDIDVYIKFIDLNKSKFGLQLYPVDVLNISSDKTIESLTIGEEVKGKVMRVSEYGVYVDIGIGNLAFLHKRKMRIGKARFNLKAWEIHPMGSEIVGYIYEKNVNRYRVEITTYKPDEWEDRLPIKSDEDDDDDDMEELGGNTRGNNLLLRRSVSDNNIDDEISIDETVDINELITSNDINKDINKKYERKDFKQSINTINENFESNLIKYLNEDDDQEEDDSTEYNSLDIDLTDEDINLIDDIDEDEIDDEDVDDEEDSFNLIEELTPNEIKQIELQRKYQRELNTDLDSKTDISIDSIVDKSDDSESDDDITNEELFNYLSNNKQILTLSKLKKWDYLIDLIESKELTNQIIEDLFKQSGGRNNIMNYNNFVKFIDLLSNQLDLIENNPTSEENESDNINIVDDHTDNKILLIDDTNSVDTIVTSNVDAKISSPVIDQQDSEIEENEIDLVIDSRTDNKKDDQSTSLSDLYNQKSKTNDIFIYIFKSLAKEKGFITIADVTNWEFVESLQSNHNVNIKTIEKMFKQSLEKTNKRVKSQGLDVPGFEHFVDLLSTVDITTNNDIADSILDEFEDKESNSQKLVTNRSNSINQSISSDFIPTGPISIESDNDDDRELLESVFNAMANGKSYLSLKDLLDWDLVIDLIVDGELTEETLKERVIKFGGDSKGIKLDGFDKLVDDLISLYKEIPEDNVNLSANTIDINDNEIIQDDEEGFELEDDEDIIDDVEGDEFYDIDIDEVFNELSQGKNYISKKQIKSWTLIKNLYEDQFVKLNDKKLEVLLDNASIEDDNKIDITKFEQFIDELLIFLDNDDELEE